MPVIKNLDELRNLREAALRQLRTAAEDGKIKVLVGMGTCGIAVGAQAVLDAIRDTVEQEKIRAIEVAPAGCIGLCEQEPLVRLVVGGQPVSTYTKVTPELGRSIVKDLVKARPAA